MRFDEIGNASAAAVELVMAPQVGREEMAKVIGYRTNAGAPSAVTPAFIGERLFDTVGLDFYVAFGVASGNWTPMGVNTLTATELAFLDGATAGTQVASKAVVADANVNIGVVKATQLHIGASGSETQVTATAAELNYTDVTTAGTAQASKALVVDANIDITGVRNFTGATLVDTTSIEVSNLKAKDSTAVATIADSTGLTVFSKEVELGGNIMSTEAGAGITGGTGTVYRSGVVKVGGIIYTQILIDLTGLASSTTDLDIIGQGASVAHLGQITAARNGTILTGTVTCLEAPAGGVTDIDMYSAAEGTGVFDDGVAALTETALVTSGGAWSAGTVKVLSAWPAANEYLYLTGGAAGTAATYTAGKFLIKLEGYDA